VSEIPDNLRFSSDHEWAVVTEGNTVRIGITDFAQNSLGDIVFVSVHDPDGTLSEGEVFGEVESTKSVSDLYAPVSGQITARNEALDDSPELVNSDPYGEGWIIEVAVDDPGALDRLLDAAAYQQLTESE